MNLSKSVSKSNDEKKDRYELLFSLIKAESLLNGQTGANNNNAMDVCGTWSNRN